MNPNHPTIAMQQFLLGLIYEIKDCRTALYDFVVDSRCYLALGHIVGALNLGAIDGNQYDRLTAIVLNAAALRREELLLKQPLHSRIVLQAYLQAKAAKKQVAA